MIIVKLLPNTVEGLLFGLNNFDGIEFDIRLTKDKKLVIHHDAFISDGRFIADLTLSELQDAGINTLYEFFSHSDLLPLLKKGKSMWVEAKPDCNGKKPIKKEIAYEMYEAFELVKEELKIPNDNIHMLSFAKEMLTPFVENDYKAYPILPYVNECDSTWVYIAGIPRVLLKSLKSHMFNAVKSNYRGILFARQFFIGFTGKRHPSYEKLVELMDETGVELGTNLGDYTLEHQYPRFHRFSDQTAVHPRFARQNEGHIIAHRGTGTKGIELLDN